MTRFLFSLMGVLFLLSCAQEQKEETEAVKKEEPKEEKKVEPVKAEYSIETFESEHGGWGYTILEGGKAYIHQPHIPSVQGLNGFSTEVAAQTCGDFVKNKLENGIMPPSVTQEELDSLGVL